MKTRKQKDRFRMETSALNQQYDEFRKAVSPRFDGNVPYDNRHTAATNQHKRAADYGLDGAAIALYDNHDYNVALNWYIAPLYEEVEIVCRYGDELIVLCEQMIAFSLQQYQKFPWQSRHLAAAKMWQQLLGRTQLRQQLKDYRGRKFDLPSFDKLEQEFKRLFEKAGRRQLSGTPENDVMLAFRSIFGEIGKYRTKQSGSHNEKK